MTYKISPQRSCVVCRKKTDKSNLVKLVCNKNGQVQIDENQNLAGRGAYICADLECAKKALKTKAFNRAFKQNISQEIYEELIQKFGNNEN